MKYIPILLLVLAVACRTTPSARNDATGAENPRAAVEAFMSSMQAQDIQATASIWGTRRGAARDVLPDRSQLEKRVLVMQCHLGHDRYSVLADATSAPDERVMRISLVKGNLTRETTVRTVQGPASRWYVEWVDLEPVQDFCRA